MEIMVLVVTIVMMVAVSKMLRRSIYINGIIKFLAGVFTTMFVAVLLYNSFGAVMIACDNLVVGSNNGVFVFLIGGTMAIVLMFLGYCLIGSIASRRKVTF